MLYCSIVLIHISSFCFVFAIHNFFSCYLCCGKVALKFMQLKLAQNRLSSSVRFPAFDTWQLKLNQSQAKSLFPSALFCCVRQLSGGWELRGNVDSWVLCENSWIFTGCFGNCVYRSPFTVERCRWNHLCMHMRRIDYSSWSLASHSHPHARSHWPVLGLSLTAQLHLFNINDSIGPGGVAGASMSEAIAERS